MAKFTNVTLLIGLAIMLALATGFVGWQLGDGAKTACQTVELSKQECCGYDLQGGVPKLSTYYNWVASSSDCSGQIVSRSYCSADSYYSDNCQDAFRFWFAMVSLFVGSLAIGLGIFWKTNETLQGGLILGGAINLVMAVISAWSWLTGWTRVVLAVIIFFVLAFLAYKRFNDSN